MDQRLSLQHKQALRSSLSELLKNSSTEAAAWQAGLLSETPATAFFCGYQAAMRCLDPSLATDIWTAFCISESGMRSLRDMQTTYSVNNGLNGCKSHIMLVDQGMDRLYISAREENKAEADHLLCVTVNLPASGIEIIPATKPQPFLPELPHTPVRFSAVKIDTVFSEDAHRQLNRPFRYWEDVHVGIALAGWLAGQFAENNPASKRIQETTDILMAAFLLQPSAYHLPALDAFEALLQLMDDIAPRADKTVVELWQRDRILLQMMAPLRNKIRQSLSAPSL